ncbi:hypothetical protein QR680_013694 [Steinernema hermaphroditum]|uniref:F-box domain-containing protein n=1 Tax=Steinernema hermaphroditum TaxID=289476 RepID=A0AA39I6D4_9BILA|nr:hypothetical protein QR680_013694 [Steinernema hermaphroditum]
MTETFAALPHDVIADVLRIGPSKFKDLSKISQISGSWRVVLGSGHFFTSSFNESNGYVLKVYTLNGLDTVEHSIKQLARFASFDNLKLNNKVLKMSYGKLQILKLDALDKADQIEILEIVSRRKFATLIFKECTFDKEVEDLLKKITKAPKLRSLSLVRCRFADEASIKREVVQFAKRSDILEAVFVHFRNNNEENHRDEAFKEVLDHFLTTSTFAPHMQRIAFSIGGSRPLGIDWVYTDNRLREFDVTDGYNSWAKENLTNSMRFVEVCGAEEDYDYDYKADNLQMIEICLTSGMDSDTTEWSEYSTFILRNIDNDDDFIYNEDGTLGSWG